MDGIIPVIFYSYNTKILRGIKLHGTRKNMDRTEVY